MSKKPPSFRLEHPCGLRLEAGLRESVARAIQGVEIREMGNGYVWCRLPHGEIAGQTIAMSLCFFQQSFQSLSVAIVDPERYGASWADWSAEKEAACSRATGQWLEAIGYAPGKYSWGVVYASTDPKTSDVSCGVRFDSA